MDAKIIADRWKRATPGPWIVYPDIRPGLAQKGSSPFRGDLGGYCDNGHLGTLDKYANNMNDAEAIANAPTDVEFLLQANADQAAQMEAMREALVLADKAMRTIAFSQCHDGGKARARAMDAIKTVLSDAAPTQSAADRLAEAALNKQLAGERNGRLRFTYTEMSEEVYEAINEMRDLQAKYDDALTEYRKGRG